MNKFSRIKESLISAILNNKAAVIFLILVIFFSFTTQYFMRVENIINILRQISSSAIMGVGFTLVVASGNLDLSVGRMLGLIGVVTGLMSKVEGMPFLAVILAGLLLGLVCGFLNGFIGRKFKVPMFIMTLAMSGVFQGLCYIISHASTVARLPDEYAFFGQGYLFFIPFPVFIMIIMVAMTAIILYHTKLGRYILAVGGNAEASRASGINLDKTIIIVYTIMGFCVAVAALIMTGRSAAAQPDAGSNMVLDTIAAVVIGGTTLGGGKGKVVGTLFGCLMVGVITNGLNLLGIDINWQIVAKSILIIIAVVLDSQATLYFKRRSIKAIV